MDGCFQGGGKVGNQIERAVQYGWQSGRVLNQLPQRGFVQAPVGEARADHYACELQRAHGVDIPTDGLDLAAVVTEIAFPRPNEHKARQVFGRRQGHQTV